ncbi:MAG: HAD family phosphatase [Mariniphaga sp.]|nr:HAD family phosphatase [Mariniphaga sp.]
MKIDLKGIKNIIFDLGGVILDLNFNASVLAFYKLGLKEDVLDGKLAYSDKIFYQLQTGQVSPEKFRIRVREILGKPEATDQQIDDAWSAMLDGIPFSRIETIQKLRKKYKVFLYSNTNKIHIDKLEKEFSENYGFSFASCFNEVFYSQEIHDAKPAVSSFLKIIELSGVNPHETLFVDDIQENIEGAEKAGLKTFWLKEELEMNEIFKDN